jgi:hypothetical protein
MVGLPLVDSEVIWDEPDGYYHRYPSMQQIRTWLADAGFAIQEEAEGPWHQKGYARTTTYWPAWRPRQAEDVGPLALGSAAIPLSGAARLQRITWPSTFADHQAKQRSAWRSLEDC